MQHLFLILNHTHARMTRTRSASTESGEIKESGRSSTRAANRSPPKDRTQLPRIPKMPGTERKQPAKKGKATQDRRKTEKSPSPPLDAAEKAKARKEKKELDEATAKIEKLNETAKKTPTTKASATKAPPKAAKGTAAKASSSSKRTSSPSKAKAAKVTKATRKTKEKTYSETERSKASIYRGILVSVVTLMQGDDEGGYRTIIGNLELLNNQLLDIAQDANESSASEGETDYDRIMKEASPKAGGRKRDLEEEDE